MTTNDFKNSKKNPTISKSTKLMRVASPCVNICALDDLNVCMGCHRNIDEIQAWGSMDDNDRLATLNRCRERARPWIIQTHKSLESK